MFGIMAEMQRNSNEFQTVDNISLNQCSNLRLLYPANTVDLKRNVNENPELFKRGSEQSIDIERQSVIPAKKAFYMLGLGTVEQMKQVFSQYVTQEEEITDDGIIDYQPHVDD